MADLGGRIRGAVDPVEPIGLAEVQTVTLSAIGRRPVWVLGGVAIALIAVVGVVFGLVATRSRSSTRVTVTSTPNTAVTSSATKGHVTVILALRDGTVRAGTRLHGSVTVDNETGHRLQDGDACPTGNFSVTLFGGGLKNVLGSGFECTHPYAFRTGKTVFGFEVATTDSGAPLAAGAYRLDLAFYPGGLPVPPPVPVTLSPAHSPPRIASSTATGGDITTTVVLDEARARAGTTIDGSVIVTNRTKATITKPLACEDTTVEVALSNSELATAWGWSAVGCLQAFGFPPGRTTIPVVVTTMYNAPHTGFGPIPAGRYQAKLYVNRLRLPIPAAIPVTITATNS